jgi:hypothetical protein
MCVWGLDVNLELVVLKTSWSSVERQNWVWAFVHGEGGSGWFWAAASLLDLATEWAQYNTKLTLQIIKINIETGWTRLDDLVHAFVPRAGIDGDAGEKGESYETGHCFKSQNSLKKLWFVWLFLKWNCQLFPLVCALPFWLLLCRSVRTRWSLTAGRAGYILFGDEASFNVVDW